MKGYHVLIYSVATPGQNECMAIDVPDLDMKSRVYLSSDSSLEGGLLKIIIQSINIKDGAVERIELNHQVCHKTCFWIEHLTNVTIQNNEVCAYPGPNWSSIFNENGECLHTFSSAIPFKDALESCDFTMEMTTAMYMYQGHAAVFTMVKLSEGVMREVKTVLKFTIILPKTLKAQVDVEVVSDVEIKAWLTEKSWTWLTGLGTLEYRTVTSAPYVLQASSIIPPSLVSAIIEENTLKANCPDDKEEECVQYWTVTVDPEVSICSFC